MSKQRPTPKHQFELWADLDGVAPETKVTDHPALSLQNPTTTITLFKGKTGQSRPTAVYEAPVYATSSQQITMLDGLNALSDLQRAAKGTQPYYSFGQWAGAHVKQAHIAQTALCLEYDVRNATKVSDILKNDFGVAFWVIPTHTRKTNCFMFALPLVQPLVNKDDPKRIASLIVEALGQPGLSRDCYNPTYFFKMRSDSALYFSDGNILDGLTAKANAKGILTNLAKYER